MASTRPSGLVINDRMESDDTAAALQRSDHPIRVKLPPTNAAHKTRFRLAYFLSSAKNNLSRCLFIPRSCRDLFSFIPPSLLDRLVKNIFHFICICICINSLLLFHHGWTVTSSSLRAAGSMWSVEVDSRVFGLVLILYQEISWFQLLRTFELRYEVFVREDSRNFQC